MSHHEFLHTTLEAHADTCCTGSNMVVLVLTGEKVNVFSFSENLPTVQEVPIASVCKIWEELTTGELWLLVILHKALYFGDHLRESLLCPNQLWAAGNLMKDVPTQFNSESSHSIVVKDQIKTPFWSCMVSFCMCAHASQQQTR